MSFCNLIQSAAFASDRFAANERLLGLVLADVECLENSEWQTRASEKGRNDNGDPCHSTCYRDHHFGPRKDRDFVDFAPSKDAEYSQIVIFIQILFDPISANINKGNADSVKSGNSLTRDGESQHRDYENEQSRILDVPDEAQSSKQE